MKMTIKQVTKVILAVVLVEGFGIAPASSGEWTATGAMSLERAGHTATLLPDGRVLVTGGDASNPNGSGSDTAEIYDPSTDLWSPVASMDNRRIFHSATLLSDGTVLVFGGGGGAAIYDPIANSWAPTGSPIDNRIQQSATLLNNGNVLVAMGRRPSGGGFFVESAVFDSSTGLWVRIADLPNSMGSVGLPARLPDGKLLFVGKESFGLLFDPEFYSWSKTSATTSGHELADTVLLKNGDALICSGGLATGGMTGICDIFRSDTLTWEETGSLIVPRLHHRTAVLSHGKVMVMGGYKTVPLSSVEIYDPVAGLWSAAEPMQTGRWRHTATKLTDGRVLVVGGFLDGTDSAEVYAYAPGIEVQPMSITLNEGRTAILEVVANGGGDQTYEWRKNGVVIPDEDSSVLKITTVELTDVADYSVIVANASGSVTSDPATVTVLPDADHDGLTDAEETEIYNTEPNEPDTDGDGLNDYAEVFVHMTNPREKDSDGDGFQDRYEIETGKSPTDSLDKPDLVADIRVAVEFSFASEIGNLYDVEASDDLESWTMVEPAIEGTGNLVSRFYSTRDFPQRYFRAEESGAQ